MYTYCFCQHIKSDLIFDATQDPRNLTVEIFDTMIVQRLDRAPDRVEISPEQLASSVAYCDKLSETYNRRIVAVGWYHSHPRITVNPSHVGMVFVLPC
jgi:BRCA1/BRCA2-containing complex subunit 3